MAYVKNAGITNYFDEEKYYTSTKDYGNLSLVELRFQEMRRELERINEIVNDVKSALNSLVSAINALAGLVGAATIPSSSATVGIDSKMKNITSFVQTQIERYANLNEFTYEQIKRLDSLLMKLFDVDGQLVTYTVGGKEVTETFNNLLKRKENGTVLTNPYKDGYREFNGSEWIRDNLNVSEDRWENFEKMYAYFANKGFTDEQISGIMANAAGESGFDMNAKNSESTAKGFFQWLDNRYPDNWDVESQLNHAWEELGEINYGGITTLERMESCTTPEQASNVFLQYFEGAGPENYETNPNHAPLYAQRRNYASAIYNYIKKMKGETTNTVRAA